MATRTTTRRTAKAKTAPAPEPEIEDLELDDAEETVEEAPTPAPKRRTKAAAKPAPVVEEDDDDLELEDVAEDEPEADEKPAKTARKKIEYGSAWLAEYINEQCGTEYTAYNLRGFIRSLVKKGAFDRAVGEDRSRYEFTGPQDPKVIVVLNAVKENQAKPKDGADKLDNLAKARAARKANLEKAKAEGTTTKGKKTKAVAPVEVEEIEDDEEIDEIDDLDDDE